MRKEKRILKIVSVSILMVLLFATFSAIGTDTISEKPYNGFLRIYITEIESRWDDYDGNPYHYGFMDFAFDDSISIDYLDSYTDSIIWNGDVAEQNVMVLAAVFNPVAYTKDAYPPTKRYFDAYYVDAAAGAIPGETGHNTVNQNFTHTVFAEEGTATWCHNCPDMAEKLHTVYESGEYPFYYVALVSDENDIAKDRLKQDYRLYGYPTGFLDGGNELIIGEGVSENIYRSKIESCGARDVHELDLSLTVSWLGRGSLQIDIEIYNNEEIFYPDKPVTPEGPTDGNRLSSYTYCTSTTDPEGDQIYYKWDWGNGEFSGWIGPFNSGEEICTNNTWEKFGTYNVRIKAKDINDNEGPWSDPLSVSMPRNRLFAITILIKLLERYPNAFPILRLILG